MALYDLIPWRKGEEKTHPLVAFQREMNRLFENFFSDFEFSAPSLFGRIGGEFVPRLDVSEDDKAVTVTAELPGMEAKDVKIEVTGNTLSISGEKKEEIDRKEADFHRVERAYGAFKRCITLPGEIKPDKVDARFKNGVLTITLPKEESVRGRKIEIKSG